MYLGDFPTGATVYFKFPTSSAAGARTDPNSAWETNDVRVYKDAGTAERTSQAGYTVTSTFDSMTGITHVSIDLSDNTDAGFYAAGHDYQVVLYPDETVDGQNVADPIAHFSIQNRYGPAAILALLPTALVGGKMDSHVNDIANNAITAASMAADASTEIAGAILLDTTKKLFCDATGQVRTTLPILINTALNNYEFPMVLSTDHISPADGKTVTVQRSIDGGAWTACTNSPTTSQPTGTNGTYKIDFSAADRNGTVIRFRATAAGCDPTEWLMLMQA